VIGGKLTSSGTNAKLGYGEFIVVEADESMRLSCTCNRYWP